MGGMAATAISALRAEHDALISLVDKLEPSDLERPSHATGWTVAKVLSHLGSGAEINASNLRAALGVGERIPQATYPELWARWDAASSLEQCERFRHSHDELVMRFEKLQSSDPDILIQTMMGDLPAQILAGIRLREAALHRWDIAVAFDERARLLTTSVPLLIDQLPEMISKLARSTDPSQRELDRIAIEAVDTDRSLVLTLRDPVTVELTKDQSPKAGVRLPGEAVVRLLYGRLPDRDVRQVADERPAGLLQKLRGVFQGF